MFVEFSRPRDKPFHRIRLANDCAFMILSVNNLLIGSCWGLMHSGVRYSGPSFSSFFIYFSGLPFCSSPPCSVLHFQAFHSFLLFLIRILFPGSPLSSLPYSVISFQVPIFLFSLPYSVFIFRPLFFFRFVFGLYLHVSFSFCLSHIWSFNLRSLSLSIFFFIRSSII